jgi:hypothetical protein
MSGKRVKRSDVDEEPTSKRGRIGSPVDDEVSEDDDVSVDDEVSEDESGLGFQRSLAASSSSIKPSFIASEGEFNVGRTLSGVVRERPRSGLKSRRYRAAVGNLGAAEKAFHVASNLNKKLQEAVERVARSDDLNHLLSLIDAENYGELAESENADMQKLVHRMLQGARSLDNRNLAAAKHDVENAEERFAEEKKILDEQAEHLEQRRLLIEALNDDINLTPGTLKIIMGALNENARLSQQRIDSIITAETSEPSVVCANAYESHRIFLIGLSKILYKTIRNMFRDVVGNANIGAFATLITNAVIVGLPLYINVLSGNRLGTVATSLAGAASGATAVSIWYNSDTIRGLMSELSQTISCGIVSFRSSVKESTAKAGGGLSSCVSVGGGVIGNAVRSMNIAATAASAADSLAFYASGFRPTETSQQIASILDSLRMRILNARRGMSVQPERGSSFDLIPYGRDDSVMSMSSASSESSESVAESLALGSGTNIDVPMGIVDVAFPSLEPTPVNAAKSTVSSLSGSAVSSQQELPSLPSSAVSSQQLLSSDDEDEEKEEKGGTKRKRRRKSSKKHTKKQIKKGGRKKRRTQKNKRKNKRKTNKK